MNPKRMEPRKTALGRFRALPAWLGTGLVALIAGCPSGTSNLSPDLQEAILVGGLTTSERKLRSLLRHPEWEAQG